MAKIKLARAVYWLNDRYDADVTYQQAYMAGLRRQIPVERDDTDRFWVVDESNLAAIAKAFGLGPAKPKPGPKSKPATKPAGKPKPAAAKPSRTARRTAA
jgi:hypothetical protein